MTEFVDSLSYIQLALLCGAFFGAMTAAISLVGFALEKAFGEQRRIYELPLAEGQLRWEMFGNVRFVVMAAFAFAWLLYVVPTVPAAQEGFGAIAFTFVTCWLGFEIYYWGLHRAMHTRRLFRFHRLHHDSRVTTPLTGYSMSTAESLGWLVGLVGVPLLVSLATPMSIVGFFLYHGLYQIPGNVAGHANVDPFPAGAHTRLGSWITHPTTYHSLHHARFNNHYSFGSTFMDRLLGTEWADWPALHARVIGGQPMRKLSERGDEPSNTQAI
jgi:lathosterol oxidase